MEKEPYASSESISAEEFRQTLDSLPEETKARVKSDLKNGEIVKVVDEIFAAKRNRGLKEF